MKNPAQDLCVQLSDQWQMAGIAEISEHTAIGNICGYIVV